MKNTYALLALGSFLVLGQQVHASEIAVKCSNDAVNSIIIKGGIEYLVVDNEVIKNRQDYTI